MFELSVACKYLLPRWRQLSVSIISLISTLVISLVVWLIVVFFSVTDGLESNWVHKLIALTAPVRITPTEAYYNSYYHQIDSLSYLSDYSAKTISEKLLASAADPYDPEIDEEIPSFWPAPDINQEGELKDLVALSYQSLEELKPAFTGLRAQDFELTLSHIYLGLLRENQGQDQTGFYTGTTRSVLSYPAYLGNFESDNSQISRTLIPLRMQDLTNVLNLSGIAANKESDEESFLSQPILQQHLKDFFEYVHVTKLKTASTGWIIPRSFLPPQAYWAACVIMKGQEIIRIVIPQNAQNTQPLKTTLEEQGFSVVSSHLKLENLQLMIELQDGNLIPVPPRLPIVLEGGVELSAQLDTTSIDKARKVQDIRFFIDTVIQHSPISGKVPYRQLELGAVDFVKGAESSPLWIHQARAEASSSGFILPHDKQNGDGVLLPKSFKDAGVLVGDRGHLTYLSPTASTLQEQHLPIYVAGFYDPGIIPIGGKFVLANREVVTLIRSAHQQEDKTVTNGINVHFNEIDRADALKEHLIASFKQKGIERYWNIETYREYEFTKEIMQELQSQKNIFSLIALVIIVVACSNIISMLIILVNDKKVEIGILRSMGASSKSIAFIFGFSGGVIGIIGSGLGIAAAILTLNYLPVLLGLIGHFQGHDMFNAAFYGESLPHEISYNALSFVLVATIMISLLAGIVPAVKACLLRPTSILKSSGG